MLVNLKEPGVGVEWKGKKDKEGGRKGEVWGGSHIRKHLKTFINSCINVSLSFNVRVMEPFYISVSVSVLSSHVLPVHVLTCRKVLYVLTSLPQQAGSRGGRTPSPSRPPSPPPLAAAVWRPHE